MTQFNNTSSPLPQAILPGGTLLDFFFPGFTTVFTAILALLAGDLNLYARLLCVCGVAVLLGKYGSKYLLQVLESHFTSTVYVLPSDEVYDMLLSWVSSQLFASSARSLLANVDRISSQSWWYRRRRNEYFDEDDSNKKLLHYTPWNGKFYFWHKGRLFIFQRKQRTGESSIFQPEDISVSVLGRSPNAVMALLDECRIHYLALIQNKVCIFEHKGDEWKPAKPRNKRNPSTIVLNQKLKHMLLSDVSDFLQPETQIWYTSRGIPYQRGYLLYGPPGTGKSSVSLSIAGQLDLDLYILDLSSIGNGDLRALFASLPRRCLVLLEDIDAAAPKRPGDTDTKSGNGRPHPTPKDKETTLSLSTLLNVLDGMGSAEGRVLIMTTNHIERIDGALIRPGRADVKLEFQLADEKMMAQLFCFVYLGEGGGAASGPDPAKAFGGDETVRQLAQSFAAKVPKEEFSPAEIMSLLLTNKQSPEQAVGGVEAWVQKTREEKRKAKRADSWVFNE